MAAIMKKLFKSLFVIIAAMVTFAGCMKEDVNTPASETKTVQFFAESIETKTHFGDASTENGITSYPTLWDEGDKVKVFLNLPDVSGTQNSPTVEVIDEGISASFKAEITDPAADEYTFYAVVPADRYNGKSSNEGRFTVQIPSAQEPQSNSVDKVAQVLYAISETTNSFPESVQLDFKHFTAYGKLSLTNLSNKISTISSITLEFDGVSLAGKWNYFVEDGSVSLKEEDAKLVLTTSATENIWFACAPVDVSSKELTLTVNTDKGPLERKVTFPANRKFEAGKISTFTINMDGIEPTVSDEEWVSTAFADLQAGDQVVIVSTKGNAIYAMSNDNGTSSAPKPVAVTYSNDKLLAKPADNIIWSVGGDNSGRIFYPGSDESKCLYCTNANNGVRVGVNANNTFTSENGYLKHNSTSRYLGVYNNQDWRCYTNTTGNIAGQTFQFFVKTGESGGEDPVEKTLESIAVSNAKTEYTVGDEFAKPVVTATYSDDTNELVTEFAEFTGYNMSVAGTYTVTVSYSGKITTYSITVSAIQGGGEDGGDTTGGTHYVKVTETPADWTGDYLIVYEDGNVAFNGSLTTLDAVSNTVSVVIEDGKIEATDAMKSSQFTIDASGNVKSASGYYIGQTSNANGLKSSQSTQYINTISVNNDGTVDMVSGGAYLRYNASSGQYRFRYYKSNSYTGQKAIQLYKLN